MSVAKPARNPGAPGERGMDGGRIGWPEMPVAGPKGSFEGTGRNRKTEISVVFPEFPLKK